MAFPITGLGVVNALGASAEEVATNLVRGRSALQRTSRGDRSIFTGRVETALTEAPSRAHALLHHAADQIAREVAGARRRWGSRRVAVVLGCGGDPSPLLHLAAARFETRGPIYAVTTGSLASAQAAVSACGLLAADLADAVAVGAASVLDPDDPGLGDEPPRPLSPHSTGRAPGEGAAWMLLERQATSDFELLGAEESLDVASTDWVVTDANGDPARDRDRLHAHQGPASLVALAGYWGDLGPASGLMGAVAAVLALDRGFVPASCLYDGHDPRIPTRTIHRDCDRVACTSSHGSTHVTLSIGARSP